MQITPMPGVSWSNAATAQQATNDPRTSTTSTNPNASAKPAIGDVERSAETLDRDANGQYTPGRAGNPSEQENPDENEPDTTKDLHSLMDLPAIGQSSELDLMG